MSERYCAHGREERVCPLCSLDWNEMRLRAETAEAKLSAISAALGSPPDILAAATRAREIREAAKARYEAWHSPTWQTCGDCQVASKFTKGRRCPKHWKILRDADAALDAALGGGA